MEETGVILSEEDQSQFKLFHAVIDDDTSMIANEKSKRNDNSRAAISIGIAMLCGKSVKASGLKSVTSTAFGINRRRIARSIQKRASQLANRESVWMYMRRKTKATHYQRESAHSLSSSGKPRQLPPYWE